MGIFDIFSSSSGVAAAGKSKKAIKKAAKKGYEAGAAAVKSGTQKQVGSLTEALAPFEELFGQNQEAENLRLDALGVNGPEAAAAARAAFQASPGYQYQLDQGNQSVLRNNAAIGGLSSGKTLTDLQDYSQNLANQDWGNWLTGLGMRDPQQSATGMAGVLTNIGNAYGTEGVNLSNLATNKFNTLGQANSQYAQDVFGAKNAANQNIWGAIGGLGSGLTSLAGMGMPGAFGSGGTIGGALTKRLIG